MRGVTTEPTRSGVTRDLPNIRRGAGDRNKDLEGEECMAIVFKSNNGRNTQLEKELEE